MGLKELLLLIQNDPDFRAAWEANPWQAVQDRDFDDPPSDEIIRIAVRGNLREIEKKIVKEGDTGTAVPLVIIDN